MAVEINLKLNVDDKSAKKTISELRKSAKTPVNIGAQAGGLGVGKVSPASPVGKLDKTLGKVQSAFDKMANSVNRQHKEIQKQGGYKPYLSAKAKRVAGIAGMGVSAAGEGIHTGASLASRLASGQQEFISGGFMGAVHGKVSAIQDIGTKSREGYTSIKEAYKGREEKRDEQGNVTQTARKGGFGAGMIAGIPVVGGMIGAAAGGIMQMVHEIGQEYTSAMGTQQGTIGATGGYVGGGGGKFANAQMAQAQIAMRRTQGQLGFDEKGKPKGIQISGRDTSFAAQQNIGIAQYAEQLGQLKENDKSVSTDFLRGAADINKMTGLKQGQFVAKLASYSNALKESGYSQKGIKQFAQVTAGLAQTGMTGERAMTVGQNIDQDMRKGLGGGTLSKLAVSGLMESGMSMHEARKTISKGGITDPRVRAALNPYLEGMDEEVRTHLMEKEGWGNYGEMSSLKTITAPKISKKGGEIESGFNAALDMTNKRMQAIVGTDEPGTKGVGQMAAELSQDMAKNQLQLFQDHAHQLKSVIGTLETMEKGVFAGIDVSLKKMEEYFAAFESGELGKKIGQDLKEGFGSLF